jgi:hypothetical protein
MCNLDPNSKPKGRWYKGYKVVYELNGKNYSPAMGFCYDDFEEIPVVKKQKRLGNSLFTNHILNSGAYKFDMLGRTGVFVNKKDASFLRGDLIVCKEPNSKGTFKVKRVRIAKNLLFGWYNEDKVIAGSKLTFLE